MATSNTATSPAASKALWFTHSARHLLINCHILAKNGGLFCAEHISVKAAAKKYGRKGERGGKGGRREDAQGRQRKEGEKKMAQCSAALPPSFFFRQLCFSITSRPRNLCPPPQQQARTSPPPPQQRGQCRRQPGGREEQQPCVSTRETLTHCPFFFFFASHRLSLFLLLLLFL